MIKKDLKKTLILESDNIENALKKLNKNSKQILFVVNKKKKFVGTITDGDIRRSLIKKISISSKLKKVLNKKSLYVNQTISYDKAKIIMENNYIRYLPILDKNHKIINYFSLQKDELKIKKNIFFILAGGFGKRLLPFTKTIPKPMLKIGNKPILEHIINSAKKNRFKNFVISVHYLSKKIINYFKNGEKFNIKVRYIVEERPYGTAGSLRFLKKKTLLPIVVSNGDILTNLNYEDLLDFHKKKKSDLTIVVRSLVHKNPYGVVNIIKNRVSSLEEKKDLVMNINAGIYVINPKVLTLLKHKKIDMPDFINLLIKNKKKIFSFPLNDNWIDIGTKKNLNFSKKMIN
tara:strand:+ start:195 stop:1232 length:1038 start_codon:yes stop_codon:yes gene_type:complete